jgi:phage anti-repressor protein
MKTIVLNGVEVALNDNLFIDMLGLQRAADVVDIESLRPALWLVQWPGLRVAEAASQRLGMPSVVHEDYFIFAAKEVGGAYLRAAGSHLQPVMTLEVNKLKENENRARAQAEGRTDNAPSRNALRSLEPTEPTGMIAVNVERGEVGGIACEVVDARELWEKVGTKDAFANWVRDRIEKHNFVENQHFALVLENTKIKRGRGGDRRSKDYTLTLVSAKKIAMSEHTEAGDAVRDYFLDRERISYEAPRRAVDAPVLADIDARIDEKMDRFMDRFMDRLPALVHAIHAAPIQIASPVASTVEVASAPVKNKEKIETRAVRRGDDLIPASAALAKVGADISHKLFHTLAEGAGVLVKVYRETHGRDGNIKKVFDWTLVDDGLDFGKNVGVKVTQPRFKLSVFRALLAHINENSGGQHINWDNQGALKF